MAAFYVKVGYFYEVPGLVFVEVDKPCVEGLDKAFHLAFCTSVKGCVKNSPVGRDYADASVVFSLLLYREYYGLCAFVTFRHGAIIELFAFFVAIKNAS